VSTLAAVDLPVESADSSLDLARLLTRINRNTVGNSTDRTITNVVFLGDSVTAQLAQFFICDLIRAGVKSPSPENLIVRSFLPTISEFVIPSGLSPGSIGDNTFRVLNQQFNLPCIHTTHDLCDDSSGSELLSYNYITELLHNYTTDTLSSLDPDARQHTYIVFNYGLHIRSKHRSWVLPGMAKALVWFANSQRNKSVTVLYRETSGQAFSATPDGSYQWDMANRSAHPDSFCCSFPTQDPHESNWRNSQLMSQLDKADKSWKEYIGWIPFFDDSFALYDMRVEFHEHARFIDCTHFIYGPTAFSSLWWSIGNAVNSLFA